MSTYSMTQVEALTGISSHSLRVWERRYDLLTPLRTSSNIRYYSDEQLKKLINIGILVRNSHRISKIAKMSDHDIHDTVSKILQEPVIANAEDINALTISMLEMDEEKFNTIFQSYIIRKGMLTTIVELVYPFLHHVGVLWGINKAMPAQEHFISNLIRQKLIAAIDSLAHPHANAPKLILFLIEGEDHELGLLLANYIAKDCGWRTYYLGQNVPLENIKQVEEDLKSDLMFSLLISPRNSKFIESLNIMMKSISSPLLLSGNSHIINKLTTNTQVSLVESPLDLVNFLNSTRSSVQ